MLSIMIVSLQVSSGSPKRSHLVLVDVKEEVGKTAHSESAVVRRD
jgi:hypothetical protein